MGLAQFDRASGSLGTEYTEGNIRRNPEISYGTYGYQCDFKCLHPLKVRGCGERNKTSGKRGKRVEKSVHNKRIKGVRNIVVSKNE